MKQIKMKQKYVVRELKTYVTKVGRVNAGTLQIEDVQTIETAAPMTAGERRKLSAAGQMVISEDVQRHKYGVPERQFMEAAQLLEPKRTAATNRLVTRTVTAIEAFFGVFDPSTGNFVYEGTEYCTDRIPPEVIKAHKSRGFYLCAERTEKQLYGMAPEEFMKLAVLINADGESDGGSNE